MKNNDAMERFGKGEVKSLFPEYKKFFDYVAGLKIPADAFSGYIGADTTKYQPVVLPDQFQSILREHAERISLLRKKIVAGAIMPRVREGDRCACLAFPAERKPMIEYVRLRFGKSILWKAMPSIFQ